MSEAAPVLQPEATIGILGGGQLGRMLALAAARLGFKCHVFAPSPDSPAFDVVHRVTSADYTDTEALDRFAGDVGAELAGRMGIDLEALDAKGVALGALELPTAVH